MSTEHWRGAVKVIASIAASVLSKKILDHRARPAEAATPTFRPSARAPQQPVFPGVTEPG